MTDASVDHDWRMLPSLRPTVLTIRRVPDVPDATWHLTDVSDSQAVASHPVCPSRALVDMPVDAPMPAPCTVIDAEPVEARFDTRMVLDGEPSIDHA